MKELTTGNCLDEILKHVLKSEDNFLTAHAIKEQLFNDLTIDEISLLFKKIGNSYDEVAIVDISEYNSIIQSNGITARFLEQGGFSKIEQNKLKELEKQQEKENLEFKKSKVDLELAEKMLKEYPKTKWFARVGFIIGICLILLEVSKLIIELLSTD